MFRPKNIGKIFGCCIVYSLASVSTCHAFLLDWDVATPLYPQGDLDHTLTDVDSSGVDIRVSFTGDTGELVSNTPRRQSNRLRIRTDYPVNTESVTATVEFFLTGTTTAINLASVSFSLWDLDITGASPPHGFVDEVSNVSGNGGTVAPTLSADATGPTITGSGSTTNSSRGNASTGNLDPEGRLDISFADINSFSFTYQNFVTLTQADPSRQSIYFDDITFVIPEASTWISLAALFVLIGGLSLRKKLRRPTSHNVH